MEENKVEQLRIYQEYLFKKGGSKFYISEGERIKVKVGVNGGMIIEGTFLGCNFDGTEFQVEDGNYINIKCADVLDIMPL